MDEPDSVLDCLNTKSPKSLNSFSGIMNVDECSDAKL